LTTVKIKHKANTKQFQAPRCTVGFDKTFIMVVIVKKQEHQYSLLIVINNVIDGAPSSKAIC
jgi:hypothetical protein